MLCSADPFFYHLRAEHRRVCTQGLSGSGDRFLVPTGLSATHRCHCSGLSQLGTHEPFLDGSLGMGSRDLERPHAAFVWIRDAPWEPRPREPAASLKSRKEGGGTRGCGQQRGGTVWGRS